MRLYLFLRKTEDWANVALNDCRQVTTVVEGDQAHLPVLRDWNKTFHISWQEFRLRLQQFTFQSWPDIEVVSDHRRVLDMQDDDVIIPIDDDDWLSPDIESFVRSEMRDNDLLQWTQIVNEYSNKRHIFKYLPSEICSTSDHALRVSVLKSLPEHKLLQTLYAHGSVLKNFFYTKRAYIPECKSCYNRHIGSHSMLILMSDLETLMLRAKRVEHIPPYAAWAKPLIHWLDQEILGVVNHNPKPSLKYL